MSHWVTYKNDVLVDTDIACLKQALRNMNCTVYDNTKTIENAWGNAQVDFAFAKNNNRATLGFKEIVSSGSRQLELRGDFFSTGLNQNVFMDELSQKYQEQYILNTLEKNQWYVENNTVDEDGNIIIDAFQYVY